MSDRASCVCEGAVVVVVVVVAVVVVVVVAVAVGGVRVVVQSFLNPWL